MIEDSSINQLRNIPAQPTRASRDCPEDGQLLRLLGDSLEWQDRELLETHAADCEHCIALLGRIGRLEALDPAENISEITMARARKLLQRPRTEFAMGRWAAAAAVVVVIFAAYQFGPGAGVPETEAVPAPEIRNLDHDAYRPTILSPRDGLGVGVPGGEFRWSAVPDTLHYNVRIVSVDGAMLWQEQVQDTEWRIPDDLGLVAGHEYYFRVDAYLRQAKTIRSRHVMFTVDGEE